MSENEKTVITPQDVAVATPQQLVAPGQIAPLPPAVANPQSLVQPPVQPSSQSGFDKMVQAGGGSPNQIPEQTEDMTGPEPEAHITTGRREWSTKMNFKPDQLSYPQLRIGQSTTPEVQAQRAKMCDLVLSMHDPVERAVLIPIMGGTPREKRQKGNFKIIECQSIDGVTGVGIPGGSCAVCPFAFWKNTEQRGSGIPPECDEIFSFICYSVTHNMIVAFEFRKQGLNQGRMINSLVENRGLGNFAFELSAQKKTNFKGTFAIPVVLPASVDDKYFVAAKKLAGLD